MEGAHFATSPGSSTERFVPGPDTLFPCASLSKPVSATLLAAGVDGPRPLSAFKRVNLNAVTSVSFRFDQKLQGNVLIDDVAFAAWPHVT